MKKRITVLFLAILLIFSLASFATENIEEAAELETDGGVSSILNANIEKGDLYLFEADSMTLTDRMINGNVFVCVTPSITIKDTLIYGNLFLFSNSVELRNVAVTGSIFIATKDLTTSDVRTSDMYIAGDSINLDGYIARELKMVGNAISLNCEVDGKSFIAGNNININDETILNDEANINYSGNFIKSEKAIVNNINENKIEETTIDVEEERKDIVATKLTNWLKEILKTLIVAGFIILCTNKKIEEFSRDNIKTVGSFLIFALKGLIWIIVIPILAIILMIVSSGLLIGIPITIVVLYGIILYLSLQIVSVVLGTLIMEKYFPKKGNSEFLLSASIATSIIWILTEIPYIGPIASILTVFGGLGIMMKFMFIRKREKKDKVEVKSPEIVEEKKDE